MVKLDTLYLSFTSSVKEQGLKGGAGQNVVGPLSAQPNAGGGFTGCLPHSLFSSQLCFLAIQHVNNIPLNTHGIPVLIKCQIINNIHLFTLLGCQSFINVNFVHRI